ncbi:DNA (cytosine-5-)-methyltransferase [Actinomadura sp. NPDC023710]|uniref:DNA cytosine methyltransferase n=1 Tax=Actinomadura sp. NPDC023710 TaxID=3158219 RepID=UPI0033EF5599
MGGDGLKVLEICAGAGGQALGLEQAGFEPVMLVENDEHCCKTLRLNRPSWDVRQMDLRDFVAADHSEALDVDLLAGGVPCTPYSVAGQQKGDLDERDLLEVALYLAYEVQPRAIMIENAAELLTHQKFAPSRDVVRKHLAHLNYQHTWKILDAQAFGLPQRRRRSVLIAMRDPDAFSRFAWPAPAGPPPTVADVLLPSMASRGWPHAAEWAAMASKIGPTVVGGSKKHGGPDLGPDRAKTAWSLLGVNGNSLANELPGPTDGFELGVGRKGREGLRRLTISQVALLQGFPEDWIFAGNKTARYQQVGNAFPPPVARAVGERIARALRLEG